MQRLRSAFRTTFRSTVSNPRIRDHEEVKRNLARDVVSHTSTGNVSLHQGRYLTQEESSKRFEEAKDYISRISGHKVVL